MKTVKSPPATKQDIDNLYKKIKGEFSTKDDLKAFATKDDLKAFATKDDLKAFATKDDFKQVKNEIIIMKEEITVMKDEIMGELKSQQENQEVHNFSHSRINDDLDDHETRIHKLEKTPAAV